ncbi:MAG: S1C family serine protease, partial [Actinomycetota bacterium]|nr:S1C family serine protease [Actinomycetota bacterium]
MFPMTALPTPRGTRRRPAMAAAAAVAIASTAVACSTSPKSTAHAATGASTTTPGRVVASSASGLQDAYEQVIDRVRPEVVEISTGQGLGSGIVYDDKGDIVTNAHVVGTSTTFRVTLVDGRSVDAALVGTYPTDDLAVIKVSTGGLAPARFADSAQV